MEEFEPCGSDVFAHEESLVVVSSDPGVEFQAATERVTVTHGKHHLLDQWMDRSLSWPQGSVSAVGSSIAMSSKALLGSGKRSGSLVLRTIL